MLDVPILSCWWSHRRARRTVRAVAIGIVPSLFALSMTSCTGLVLNRNGTLGNNGLSINTTSLSSGVVGVAYSQVLAVSGGTTPYSWVVSSGTLPSGLALASNGTISGMPTASAQSSSFTVKVTDSSVPARAASSALSISISSGSSTLSISTTSLPAGTIGSSYSSTLTASGGTQPYSWVVNSGSLPTGLTLASNGTISGMVAASAQSSSFTVKVTDSSSPAQSASSQLSISITSGSSPLSITTTSLPSGIAGSLYSSALSASGGTTPYSWAMSSGTLPSGLTLSSNGTISGTPIASAQSSFTVKVTDSSSPAKSASAPLAISIASGVTATPGATATQYVMSYTATNSSQCTVEVSTSPTYRPLVHAVDPTIFANANLDGQTNTGSRAFVVGQKWIAQENVAPPAIAVGGASRPANSNLVTVNLAGQPFVVGDNITITGMANAAYNDPWARVDVASASSFSYEVLTAASAGGDTSGGGRISRADRYSLALAADTTYFYRIGGPSNTCGASPATGSFTTMNIPNGNTWAEGPLADPTNPLNQLYPSIFDARNTSSYVDPLTGALVKRLGIYGDGGIGGGSGISAPYTNGAAAGYHLCSPALSNGGYHCWIGQGQSYLGGLYWILPSTGEVRFLGLMQASFTDSTGHSTGGQWLGAQGTFGDTSDPNRFYTIVPTNSGKAPFKMVLGYLEYAGGDVAVSTGQPNGTNWTVNTPSSPWNANGGLVTPLTPDPSGTLSDLMNSCATANSPVGACFQDPNFTAAKFTGCNIVEAVGDYIKIQCHEYQQDSFSWLWVYRISTKQIVAGAPTYANATTRWCGEHQALPNLSTSWMNDNPKQNLDSTDGVEWDVKNTAAITAGSTSWTVTGALNGTSGEPQSVPVQKDANGNPWSFVQNTASGDYFIFDDGQGAAGGWPGEVVRLIAKGTCTGTNCTWAVVARGQFGTNAASHAANASISAACTSELFDLAGGFWNYVGDPKRSDTTGTFLVQGGQNVYPNVHAGHMSLMSPNFTNDYDVNISSSSWTGDFLPAIISGLPSFTNQTRASFAGNNTDSPGVSNQNYFHWDFRNASFQNSQIAALFFLGTTEFGAGASNISGHTWKFANATDLSMSPSLPYFGMQGLTLLKNISGPSSLLPNTGSSELCVAQNAGECWAGSAVGDVYVDVPAMDGPSPFQCRIAGENGPYTGHDLCVINPSMYGNAISQEGLVKGNAMGFDPRGVPQSDAANSRRLVQLMAGGWRQASEYVHTLPDGSWLMFESCVGDPHINVNGSFDGGSVSDLYGCGEFMAQIPPQPPADGIDRTNFETVQIAVGAGSGGATHARVKYGYEENEPARGTTSPPLVHFYCTQYQGTCYASDQTMSLNSTQTLAIGVPQRVLFCQVEYLNGSNQVVASDPMTTVVVP